MIGTTWCATRGGVDTLYNGLYGKAPPKRDITGLTGVVYGCKKSKPMVLYVQYLKVMQRFKVVCDRGTIFQ